MARAAAGRIGSPVAAPRWTMQVFAGYTSIAEVESRDEAGFVAALGAWAG